jgi:hypothetical protein
VINAPLNVTLYERTLTSSYGTFIDDIAPRLAGYEHTITATAGFESCTCRLIATLEEAQAWCERLLCGLIVYDSDARVVWEGFLNEVSYRIGGEQVSISLAPVANRVTVRYTLRGLGTPQVTSASSDTGSQAIYGVRDAVISVGTTDSTAADALRAAYLGARKLPRPEQTSTISTGAAGGGVDLTLTFAGWYATLDWVVLARTDTTTEATTTQVGTLIGTASPGIGATNPLLSTSTARITASGVSSPRLIAADTTYRAAIEQRLSLGNSSSQRLAWGVYESRVFVVDAWAGATPTTITYRSSLESGLIETSAGALVPPWYVRPNAMIETQELLTVGPPSGAVELPGRRFIERVVCSVGADGLSLSLEPEASSGIDARIARLSG